jgi:hypothetical protein
LCIAPVSAQHYYPGGLGNTSLLIWLNANKSSSIIQNASNQVSEWMDLSGNLHHFVQANPTLEPVYGATTGPNSKPALTFTAASPTYLNTSSLPAAIPYTAGVSFLGVASFKASTGSGYERLYDFGNGTANNNIWCGRESTSANFTYEAWNTGVGGQAYTTNNPIVVGSNNIFETVQQGGAVGSSTSVTHYAAGSTMSSSGPSGSSITEVPPSINRIKCFLGRSNWAADSYFSGTMSEILFYNTALNTTQRVILENYLAAEWGQAVSVVKYNTAATTYGTNLVGIGYTSAGDNFLTNTAGSTDGLGFNSGSGATDFLNATGYLTAAHDGQANTIINNTTINNITTTSGTIGRWNRSWNLQKTGGNGTGAVTMNFNFNDYNGSAPTATYTYGILYNATDGTYATGTNHVLVTTSTSIAGNSVSFVINAAKMSNGYYSLVWSTTGVLPVVLTGFTATKQAGSSLLQWSASQTSGIDHFEIERRTDATGFTPIGSVAVTGTSATASSYSFMDNNPATGADYYRLKMADLDGKITYSEIRSVSFAADESVAVSIYPNPVADKLHITVANSTGEISILVTNTQGQIVRRLESTSGNTMDIPVSDLNKGIYIIEVITDKAKYAREIIKK